MASGGTLPIQTGAYVGTGVAFDVVLPAGFKPKRVILMNITDPAVAIHTDTMPDASFVSQEDAATAYTSADGVTLTNDGFTVGVDAQINTSGDEVHWIAEG